MWQRFKDRFYGIQINFGNGWNWKFWTNKMKQEEKNDEYDRQNKTVI